MSRLDITACDMRTGDVCVSNGAIHATLLEHLDATLHAEDKTE